MNCASVVVTLILWNVCKKKQGFIDASVGTEELAHLELLNAILYQLLKNTEDSTLTVKNTNRIPKYEVPSILSCDNTQNEGVLFLHDDMVSEKKSQKLYENILKQVTNPEVRRPIEFLRQREIVHYQRLGEAISIIQDKMEIEKNG